MAGAPNRSFTVVRLVTVIVASDLLIVTSDLLIVTSDLLIVTSDLLIVHHSTGHNHGLLTGAAFFFIQIQLGHCSGPIEILCVFLVYLLTYILSPKVNP
jgi:hypothetical protein